VLYRAKNFHDFGKFFFERFGSFFEKCVPEIAVRTNAYEKLPEVFWVAYGSFTPKNPSVLPLPFSLEREWRKDWVLF
jgi:hypothetical protein